MTPLLISAMLALKISDPKVWTDLRPSVSMVILRADPPFFTIGIDGDPAGGPAFLLDDVEQSESRSAVEIPEDLKVKSLHIAADDIHTKIIGHTGEPPCRKIYISGLKTDQ
jgi:hypothetical protein